MNKLAYDGAILADPLLCQTFASNVVQGTLIGLNLALTLRTQV